jgi:hypothetical protein
MLEWACSLGYLEYPEPEHKEEVQFNFFHASPGQAKKPLPQPNQKKKNQCEEHTLGTFDFEGDCIKPLADIDYINPKLKKELIEYKSWRLSNKVAPGGLKSELNQVLQILGWLYRHKKIPLEDLSLEKFIWKHQLIVPVSENTDMDEHYKIENKLLRIAQQKGDENKQLVEDYLKFRERSPGSQHRYVFISLTIAKFVYRDILGTDQFPTKESIPILRRLLALQKKKKEEAKNAPNSRSYDECSVTWAQAILLVEHRRICANKTITHNKTQTIKRGYARNVRPESSLAKDLQKFLSLAFSVLIFPSRSRTYYELEIGRTFKEGAFINSVFYSVAELKGNPLWDGTTKYYLFHGMGDSKISKSQPEYIKKNGWWAEIPDCPFPDGSTFYNYIRRWLNWGRNVGKKPDHEFFFFSMYAGKRPLGVSDWRSRIAFMFEGFYGVRVCPQVLRQMFVTHLNEQKASQEVMKAEACALEHSQEISQKNYNMMHTINTIKPLIDFNQAFTSKTLGISSNKREPTR